MSHDQNTACDTCRMTSLDELVEEMARLTDAPCTLEDAEFRLIGFSDHHGGDVVDQVRQRSILERRSTDEVRAWFRSHGIETAPGPLRIPGDDALGIVGRLCVPARHLGRVRGYFWLIDPDDRIAASTWPEALRIAESAAGLLNVAERRQVHRDELFREVIEGARTSARESVTEFAWAGGFDLHEPVHCVLVERPELLDQVASRPTRSGVLWVRTGDETAAVVVRSPLLDHATTLDALLAAIGLGRRVDALDRSTRAAVGPRVTGIDDLSTAYRGAAVALRVARSRAPGEVTTWESLGPLALLGVARDADLRDTVLSPELSGFLASAPSDVRRTVQVWLDEAGSVARTAARLAVHRQTVYHRLAQVERATGYDLDRGDARLRLHLALTLAPYVEAPATQE